MGVISSILIRMRTRLIQGSTFIVIGFSIPNTVSHTNIILFKFGKANSHSAIFFEGRIYQAITGIGVERATWRERKWHKRKRHGFRILDK